MVQATGASTLACGNGVSNQNKVSSGLEWSERRVVCKTKREIETVIKFDGTLWVNSNGQRHYDKWDIENATISYHGFVDLNVDKNWVNHDGTMKLYGGQTKIAQTVAYAGPGRI